MVIMTETFEVLEKAGRSDKISPAALEASAARERVSDRYWSHLDPIKELRLWWRAQTVRHMFHVLPGETILVLAAGSGQLTQALVRATRQECPITAATFGEFPDPGPTGPSGHLVEGV